jgi:hypothetical protein
VFIIDCKLRDQLESYMFSPVSIFRVKQQSHKVRETGGGEGVGVRV